MLGVPLALTPTELLVEQVVGVDPADGEVDPADGELDPEAPAATAVPNISPVAPSIAAAAPAIRSCVRLPAIRFLMCS